MTVSMKTNLYLVKRFRPWHISTLPWNKSLPNPYFTPLKYIERFFVIQKWQVELVINKGCIPKLQDGFGSLFFKFHFHFFAEIFFCWNTAPFKNLVRYNGKLYQWKQIYDWRSVDLDTLQCVCVKTFFCWVVGSPFVSSIRAAIYKCLTCHC